MQAKSLYRLTSDYLSWRKDQEAIVRATTGGRPEETWWFSAGHPARFNECIDLTDMTR
jgi:hypothetical protein